MNIHVSIEHLVLDGLPVNGTQGALVRAAVRSELTRLLGERGLSEVSPGAVPHLSANSIQITRDSKPAPLGHQIAQAVYRSLAPAPVSTHQTRFPGGPSR
jgi:hypothetical protein